MYVAKGANRPVYTYTYIYIGFAAVLTHTYSRAVKASFLACVCVREYAPDAVPSSVGSDKQLSVRFYAYYA